MIESNWSFDLSIARQVWRDQLVEWDVGLAMRAITHLAANLAFRPKLADIVDAMRMFREKDARDALEAMKAKEVEPPKGTYATPEWVWVWLWSTHYCNPPETRSFPQQDLYADPLNTMTVPEYEALRDAWLAAGAPRDKAGPMVRSLG